MRTRLDKQPEWDERFRGWAAKFIKKNMWRCEGHDTNEKFRDLMQDAYLMFRHVLASYPEISDGKHIMALFKRAMTNDYNDRARDRQRRMAEISFETVIGEDMKLIDSLGEYNNQGYLNILLSQLPPKIKLAIASLQDEGKLAYLQRMKGMGSVRGRDELSENALCQIIGLPKGTNLLETIYSALLDEDAMSEQALMTIEQELIDAAKFTPEKKYRKRQTYLVALTRAVDKISNDQYNRLSDVAVDWLETAVSAMKSGNEVPDFHGNGNGNGHAVEEQHMGEEPIEADFSEVTEESLGLLGHSPPTAPEDAAHEVVHEEKPRRGRRAPNQGQRVVKTRTVSQKPPRDVASRTLNKWGVASGTKADIVCQLISRPGGATMKEISDATGATQYNVVNRLQRKGHKVSRDGVVIRLEE